MTARAGREQTTSRCRAGCTISPRLRSLCGEGWRAASTTGQAHSTFSLCKVSPQRQTGDEPCTSRLLKVSYVQEHSDKHTHCNRDRQVGQYREDRDCGPCDS